MRSPNLLCRLNQKNNTMSWIKNGVFLGFVVMVLAQDVSPRDLFSSMDFARDALIQFSTGTTRTVNLKTVKPKPQVIPKRTSMTGKSGPSGPSGPMITASFEKMRPVAPTTYVRQRKTYRARSTPSNKFLEALNAIERAIAEAEAAAESGVRGAALHYSPTKLEAMKKAIKLAVSGRSYPVGRSLLGKALWLIRQNSVNATRPQRRRSKRAAQNQASRFILGLKSTMGSTTFDEFMAVHGDVTLVFAIDTTGSMSDEINAAKKIAVDVINYPRENPVNYMLSPFSDPGTGPVIFRDDTEGAIFVQDINKLRAHGGGDCPELTFKALLDALLEGPDWGSPLYVFTDASAKDATERNIEDVKTLAKFLGTTINFFTTGGCRGSSQSTDPFKNIADATSGQMLRLTGKLELQRLDGLTGSVLGGSNIISVGSNLSLRKKRRAAANARYRIQIDDSVEQVSVCLTTGSKIQAGISLTDPTGVVVTSGKVSLSKVSIFQISNPRVGIWTLEVPPSAGNHEFFVKSTSDTNIDFEHYFLLAITNRRKTIEVPLSYPLKGRSVKLVITVAGAHKVNRQTVTLELVTKYGEHIMNVPLRSVDTKGVRYIAAFTPPSRPFKLKIKGNTKTGNAFERISRNIVEPKTIMLRVLHSSSDYTLPPGRRTTVIFQLYSVGPRRQRIRIDVMDRCGFARIEGRNHRTVRNGRQAFLAISFLAPLGTPAGTTDTAVVSISVIWSREMVSQAVQLIVVP